MNHFFEGFLKKNSRGSCYLIRYDDHNKRSITPLRGNGISELPGGIRIRVEGEFEGRHLRVCTISTVTFPRKADSIRLLPPRPPSAA